jgi:hypothetical protein
VIETRYHTPYLVQATMEPVVATVHVRDGEIEVWGSIQAARSQRWPLTGARICLDEIAESFCFKGSSSSSTRFDLKKRAIVNRRGAIKELLDRGGGNPTRAAPSTLRSSKTSPTLC